MELREYLRVLRRRWILIALVALVGLGGAIALTAVTKKTYVATSRDFVNVPVSLSTSQNSALAAASQFAQQRVKSYVGLQDSDTVLQPVIRKLELKDTSVSDLAGKISIENPVDTVLLDVSATDPDPARAARLSNAVAVQLKDAIERIEVSRTGTQSQVVVTVIREATTPTSAESPRPLLNYALGFVLGLALGVIIAIARERLDNGLRNVDAIAAIAGAVPLGAVPYAKELDDEPLVALRPRSIMAEAFRTIRTRIDFVDVDNPPKRLVVTSSVPGEGKSVGACNLAITVAATGLRVCLIEGDLRRPRVAGYLGLDAGAGLSDVLAGRHKLDDVLLPWNDGLLTLLPAGTTPPDPSNLLGSRQMRDLLSDLSDRFDVILIDAPPLLPVTDAAVLASAVDGALLMVRLGQTKRAELARSIAILRQANVRLLGTVATFASTKSGDYGNPYGYGYLDDVDALGLTATASEPVEAPHTAQVDARDTTTADAVTAEALEHDVTQLETVESDTVELAAVESEAVESEAVESEAVESEAVESEAVGSEAVGSEAVEPKTVQLEIVEPKTEPEAHEAVIARGATRNVSKQRSPRQAKRGGGSRRNRAARQDGAGTARQAGDQGRGSVSDPTATATQLSSVPGKGDRRD